MPLGEILSPASRKDDDRVREDTYDFGDALLNLCIQRKILEIDEEISLKTRTFEKISVRGDMVLKRGRGFIVAHSGLYFIS